MLRFLRQWQLLVVIASLLSILLHFVFHSDMPLLLLIAVAGTPLVVHIGFKCLRGNLGADMLGAIELVTAVLLSQYLAAALIVLMLAGGQALETYAVRRASSVLRELASRMPSMAHRRRGSHMEEIPIADIRLDDVIIVHPHETCPVDGVILEGHGSMDESYLTGEPYRVSKAPGASVLSGAINGESVLAVQASKLPADSRYAKIMGVMQDAEQKRPKLRRLGDQLGAGFALFALCVAGIVWLVTKDALRFLSVLVIATPCPLIIAIPITIIGAISLCARRGIIIKDPVLLERLPTCRTAIFDKTGTLTYGKPALVELVPAPGYGHDAILAMTASLERYSRHPLALSIVQAAEAAHCVLQEATQVSEKPGQGLNGMVDGKQVAVTHRKKLSPALLAQLPPARPGMECVVLVDDALAATFYFRDMPRAEGRSFITHLAPMHQFRKVMLLSGDRASEVEYLASLIGITETYASQSPEQKIARVTAEVALAPTLFMGDGINDAPALAVATVGIAFGQQSVTAEAAGAVIMESSLEKVDELMHISLRLRRIALQSAIGGMVCSLVGMAFAAAGYISPVQGAFLQEAIDVLAILNALRLTLQPRIAVDMGGATAR